MHMKRSRAVICGATGFIGRHMAEHFAADPDRFEVIGIHHLRPSFEHPAITWTQADLCDKAQVEIGRAHV
jgi:nucleoside-diphosphate-sugar epimerase